MGLDLIGAGSISPWINDVQVKEGTEKHGAIMATVRLVLYERLSVNQRLYRRQLHFIDHEALQGIGIFLR